MRLIGQDGFWFVHYYYYYYYYYFTPCELIIIIIVIIIYAFQVYPHQNVRRLSKLNTDRTPRLSLPTINT